MSGNTSLEIIAICQLFISAVIVVLAAVVIWAIFAFKRMISTKIDQAMGKIEPVVEQARSIAEQAKNTAETVANKLDAVVTRAEKTADGIADKVDSVTERVEEAINPQVAAAAGVVGAIVKSIQLYQELSAGRRSAKTREAQASCEEE